MKILFFRPEHFYFRQVNHNQRNVHVTGEGAMVILSGISFTVEKNSVNGIGESFFYEA